MSYWAAFYVKGGAVVAVHTSDAEIVEPILDVGGGDVFIAEIDGAFTQAQDVQDSVTYNGSTIVGMEFISIQQYQG